MKNYFFLFSFLISSFAIGQNANFNVQKKYVAEGYDIVAYFDNKAIKGLKEFKVDYKGASFLFLSKVNAEKFKLNPEAYIPQYGGYCAYAIAKKGKKVKINPKTFEIRNDKLYLFYNQGKSNTLQFWLNENPVKLIKQADINWLKII